MNRIIIGVVLIICLTASTTFAIPFPSQGPEKEESPEIPGGRGRDLTNKELVLIIVGAVCATVLLLALIN
jgi:hypothetical protein